MHLAKQQEVHTATPRREMIGSRQVEVNWGRGGKGGAVEDAVHLAEEQEVHTSHCLQSQQKGGQGGRRERPVQKP